MTANESDMTVMKGAETAHRHRSISYKLGWWLLVLLTGITVVGHLLAPVAFATPDETLMFWALAAMGIYTLSVLFVPYRRGERWAWWVTWVPVAIFAVVIFYAPMAGPYYLGIAGLMAVSQLATRPTFQHP